MSTTQPLQPVPNESAPPVAPFGDTEDPAGMLGMLVGMAVIATLLMGILMPFVFWVLSGVLGIFVLGCAVFSRSNLRWWCLLMGIAGLIPTTLFILVQALPTIERW